MSIVGKTNVTIELADGGWALQAVDLVAFDGGLWLAPRWTTSDDGRRRRPVRLVTLTMAESGAPAADPEAFAGCPIPETIFTDGHVPLSRARLFLVREQPELWISAE
jgi:hypothetical protein